MSTPARALITGVTGQDGSYLADYLLDIGEYQAVAGMVRRRTNASYENLANAIDNGLEILEGDMTDPVSLRNLIDCWQPTEVYNLAAQSFVGLSWAEPTLTNNVNYLGFLHLLEACRAYDGGPISVYQASSSEMFGNEPAPQNEQSRMVPRSPYGVAKLAAHRMARVYRESFDMAVYTGICFNHESPRRGAEFVTRKIAMAVAQIVAGNQSYLRLGNITAKRDWGFAGEYVKAMHLMLQQDGGNDQHWDYVIATGKTYTVAEFCDFAFSAAGLNWVDYVKANTLEDMRPAEVHELRGNPERIDRELGWYAKIDCKALAEMMVWSELARVGVKSKSQVRRLITQRNQS